jgi:hypothetical protein
VSDSSTLHSRWLLLLKIEISAKDKEIPIFKIGHNLEWSVGISATILKEDNPRNIPAKIALIWFSGFRGEDLNVIFYQNIEI